MDEKQIKEIKVLIEKASRAEKSDDALKFSQAACNAANAVNTIKNSQLYDKKIKEKIERTK